MKIVIKVISILFLLTVITKSSAFCQQSKFYISNAGSDSNDGRSPQNAIKSINKLNELQLSPGDKIFFRRGDIFYGQLVINQSGLLNKPIVISAYGKGRNPTINSGVKVINWKQAGKNLWQSDCPSAGANVTGLYMNGNSLPLGRYPNLNSENGGYLTVKWHEKRTSLLSKEFINKNWTGGEVVVRSADYILDRSLITDQSGNMFTIADNGKYEVRNGYGFFIQNHPSTLDQEGEWCYDNKTKKILLFSSHNPNGKLIEATAFSCCINMLNSSYINISDLELSNSKNYLLHARNAKAIKFERVSFYNGGEDGILFDGRGDDITIENCTLNHINNNGLDIINYTNVVIRRNTIKNVGCVPGRGKGGDGQYNGLQYVSVPGGGLIENNKIDSIGYIGISFRCSNISVRHNIISNYDIVKNDGGGIYTYNGNHENRKNQVVDSNIVMNGIGSLSGTISTFKGGFGIYMDDCSQNITIKGNTVFGCRGSGIFLHGTNNVNLTNNVSYNNDSQFFMENSTICEGGNNVIANNIFFNLNGQLSTKIILNNSSVSYTSFTNTTWTNNIIANSINKNGLNTPIFKYNGSDKPLVIKLPSTYKNLIDNKSYTIINLKPFTSCVLTKL